MAACASTVRRTHRARGGRRETAEVAPPPKVRWAAIACAPRKAASTVRGAASCAKKSERIPCARAHTRLRAQSLGSANHRKLACDLSVLVARSRHAQRAGRTRIHQVGHGAAHLRGRPRHEARPAAPRPSGGERKPSATHARSLGAATRQAQQGLSRRYAARRSHHPHTCTRGIDARCASRSTATS